MQIIVFILSLTSRVSDERVIVQPSYNSYPCREVTAMEMLYIVVNYTLGIYFPQD